MAYVKTYSKWLPYALMDDKRGFISRRYGGGHTGIDSVGNQWANPVCAVTGGTVSSVTVSPTLGNVVEYGAGRVKVAHYHLAKATVAVGQAVTAGVTQVGVEGNTGSLANGKHLHTSLWIDGVLTDPEAYLSGATAFPASAGGEEAKTMVRKVIRDDLNLRKGPGVSNASYGMIPVGTLMNVTETAKVGTATWGKHTCVMADGSACTGWSNLGDMWSILYTGVLDGEGSTREALAAAQSVIDAVRRAVGA